MRRRRFDPKSFDFTFPCEHCGYRIPPAEILHVDDVHVRCPKCGELSQYITKPAPHLQITVPGKPRS